MQDFVAEREASDAEFRAACAASRPPIELRAGLTQAELSERIGTIQSAIARLEGGSSEPRLDTWSRLAVARGCSAALIVSLEPDGILRPASPRRTGGAFSLY